MGYVGKVNIKFSDLNNIRVEKSKSGEWASNTQASMSSLRSWFRSNSTNTDNSLPSTDIDIGLSDYAGYGVQKIEVQALPETNNYYDNSADAKMRLKFIGSPHTQFGSNIKITGGGAPSTLASVNVAKTHSNWTVATGLGNASKWTPGASHKVEVSTTDTTAKVLCDFSFYLNPGQDGTSTSSGAEGSWISASAGGTAATATGTGANQISYQVVSNVPNGGNGDSVTGTSVTDTYEGVPFYKYDPISHSSGRTDVVATFKQVGGGLGVSNQSEDSNGNVYSITDIREQWSKFVATNKGSIANNVFKSNQISGSTWTGTINDPSVTLETHHGCTFIKYKLNSALSTGTQPNGGAAIAMAGSQIGAWWKTSSSNPPADFKTSWGSQFKTGNNSNWVIHKNIHSKWFGHASGQTAGTVTHTSFTSMPAFGSSTGVMTTGDDYLWIHCDNNHGGGGNGYISLHTSIQAQATFTVPADTPKINVVLTGGGGGGGGGYSNGGNGTAGGGSAGRHDFYEFDNLTAGDQFFIDVGSGGKGGVGGTNNKKTGTAGMGSRVTYHTSSAPRGITIFDDGGLCPNLGSETTGGLGADSKTLGSSGGPGGDGYFDGGLSKNGAGGDSNSIDQVKAAAAGIVLKNRNGGGTPCGTGSYGGNGGYSNGGGGCNWSGTDHAGNQDGLFGGGGAAGTTTGGDGGDGVCFLVVDAPPSDGGLETIQNLVNDWNVANPGSSMTVTSGGTATIPDGTAVTLAGATTSTATKTRFKWANRTTSTRTIFSKSITAFNSPHGPETTNQPQYKSA